MVVTFASTPLLLRGLGEAGYGLQNLAGVVAGYLAVMDFGLDVPIVKFVAEDRARGARAAEARLLSTTVQLYLLIGAVGMTAIVLASDVLARSIFRVPAPLLGPARLVFALAGLGFLATVFSSWGRAVANGCQRFDLSNLITISTSIASTLIGLAAVYLGYGVVGFVASRVGGYAVAGGTYWVVVRRLSPTFRLQWGIDRDTLRRIRSFLGSGFILRVSGILTAGLDRTLIAAWVGVQAVGVYAVPLLVVSSLGYLIAAAVGFTLPVASELSSTGRTDEMRATFLKTARFVGGVASFTFPVLIAFADTFLELWVGPSVASQAATPFRVMLLTTYFSTLSVTLANNLVVGVGRIRMFTGWWMARAVLISVGYVVLIRPLGILGAALALVLGSAVEALYATRAVRLLDLGAGVVVRSALLPAVALGVALGSVAVLARTLATSWFGLVLVVSGLGAGYVIAAFRLGIFDEREKRALAWLWKVATRGSRGSGATGR